MKYIFIFFTSLCFGQFNPIFFASGRISDVGTNPGNTNLVAYYKLDNDALEATGLSPNGTATGIDYVTGKTGNAARFNSNTDRVDIADDNNFSFTSGGGVDLPFSISMWVYFTAYNLSSTIINKRGATTDVEWMLATNNDPERKLFFQKFNNGGNTVSQGIESITPPLNSWSFIVYTDDGSKTLAGMNMYVNGVLKVKSDISTGTYTGMVNGTSITRFGLNAWDLITPSRTFSGYMEDVGVWKNRALTADEVLYLYNNGRGKTYPF